MLCCICLESGTRKGTCMTTEYNDMMVRESHAGYRTQDDFLFEILETIGILRKSNTGWTRELNVVSWNGKSPRFDIREWDPKHEKMTKGITFTKEEADQICRWFEVRGTGLQRRNGDAEEIQDFPEEFVENVEDMQ